jgi:hypothetical protein
MSRWSTSVPFPITQISNTLANISLSWNTAGTQCLATWLDANTQFPTYAFYQQNQKTWSTAATITVASTSRPTLDILNTWDSVHQRYVATWADGVSNRPMFSMFYVYTTTTTTGSWSAPALISSSTSSAAVANVAVSFFDSALGGRVIATWADSANASFPTFSIVDDTYPTWSVPSAFAIVPGSNVFTSSAPSGGGGIGTPDRVLATWTNVNTGAPMSSFYQDGGAWTTAVVISLGTSVENDVLCAGSAFGSLVSTSPLFMATWVDINDNFLAKYSIFTQDSGSWTPAANINPAAARVLDNVTVSYNSATQQFLALWNDVATGYQTYSFYNATAGSWGPVVIVSTTTPSGGDIDAALNPTTGQFLLAWSSTNNNFTPIYSLLTLIKSAPRQLRIPPLLLSGSSLSGSTHRYHTGRHFRYWKK